MRRGSKQHDSQQVHKAIDLYGNDCAIVGGHYDNDGNRQKLRRPLRGSGDAWTL